MAVTVNFVLDKQTPGSIRYTEVDEHGHPLGVTDPQTVIGTMYLRKAKLGGVIPSSLRVTIEFNPARSKRSS